MTKHCPTCTCGETDDQVQQEPELRCADCGVPWIDDDGAGHYGMRHADDCLERCPHCGGEEWEADCHREECPTIGTCAQCDPTLPLPWHLEHEWWDGGAGYSAAFRRHLAEQHSAASGLPIPGSDAKITT